MLAFAEQLRGRRSGPAVRQQRRGQSRVQEGEAPPLLHQAHLRVEGLGLVDDVVVGELREEVRVATLDVVQRPGRGHDALLLSDRSERTGEAVGVHAELGDGSGDLAGLAGVGCDPQARHGRPEAGPGQAGTQPVPQLALGLRDGDREHQPAPVPLLDEPAEAVDALRALGEQAHPRRGEPPAHPTAGALRRQQALRGGARQRLSRGLLLDAHMGQAGNQSAAPDRDSAWEDELPEHRQQQGTRAGCADLTTTRPRTGLHRAIAPQARRTTGRGCLTRPA